MSKSQITTCICKSHWSSTSVTRIWNTEKILSLTNSVRVWPYIFPLCWGEGTWVPSAPTGRKQAKVLNRVPGLLSGYLGTTEYQQERESGGKVRNGCPPVSASPDGVRSAGRKGKQSPGEWILSDWEQGQLYLQMGGEMALFGSLRCGSLVKDLPRGSP